MYDGFILPYNALDALFLSCVWRMTACENEGEPLGKDGSFMPDENGRRVQGWTVDEQGFCYDWSDGRQLLYSDGTPVIQRRIPPELEP